MAILDTVKKFGLRIKTAAGYVTYKLGSEFVQMDNGKDLQTAFDDLNDELNSKITPLSNNASKQAAQPYTAGQKYYFDEDGWIYFECQMTNANGYCRFRIFNASGSEILGYQANATATQQVAMQSGLYPVKAGWYTQLGQYQSTIAQQFCFIKP